MRENKKKPGCPGVRGLVVAGFLLPPPIWLLLRFASGLLDPVTVYRMVLHPVTPLISMLCFVVAFLGVERVRRRIEDHRGSHDPESCLVVVRALRGVLPLFTASSAVNIVAGPALLTGIFFPDDPHILVGGVLVGAGLIALVVLPLGIAISNRLERSADWFPVTARGRTISIGWKTAIVSLAPALVGALLVVGFNLDLGVAQARGLVEEGLRPMLLRNTVPVLFLAFGTIITSFQFYTTILRPLRSLLGAINAAATGDLTVRLQPGLRDEIGVALEAFNHMATSLHSSLGGIRSIVARVEESSGILLSSVRAMVQAIDQVVAHTASTRQQMETQVESVDQTSSSIEEIVSSVKSLDQAIESQASGVTESSAAIEEMISSVDSLRRSNNRAETAVHELVQVAHAGKISLDSALEEIHLLSDNSENLQQANKLIAEISARTNLLAMNAAIEAAHAGESGLGFTVVAQEIRKLAEAAADQSKAIARNLKREIDIVGSVVEATRATAGSFAAIQENVGSVSELVGEIKQGMDEQSSAGTQIRSSLVDINNITQRVHQGSREMTDGSSHILSAAASLSGISEEVREAMIQIDQGVAVIRDAIAAIDSQTGATRESLQDAVRNIEAYTL
ncbi:methyl-accepting chemotaxis protein [Alkalispirochaeta americana]|uniref:Methyl-accepting chemotaxis protein n=1 Tax=Alkalispirochaeta americana TaxID=159291 RepID=A0A1N6SYT9_9SPIO|nr:HAMP domain-containing methyl-accepting chemotaxis protein [Alkalispirochaeta americana]SIQ46230.1 methyl-accepting chemotaxis protein [Alkalispirochaeta americana]